jgi:hypothetical protein
MRTSERSSRFPNKISSTYQIYCFHLLLFEYAIRVEEWNDSIQEEGAGGLEFHLLRGLTCDLDDYGKKEITLHMSRGLPWSVAEG